MRCARVSEYEAENSMTIQNLAIVFGPTLFKQAQPGLNGNLNGMADAPLQNKARHPPGPVAHPSSRANAYRARPLRRSSSTTPISLWTRATRSRVRRRREAGGVRAIYLLTL